MLSTSRAPSPAADPADALQIYSRYSFTGRRSRRSLGPPHAVAIKPKDSVMTTNKLRIVNFGSARALTRDLLGGDFIEVNLNDSREIPVG